MSIKIIQLHSKETLEKQTREFAKKITSKDFIEKITAMRKRGGICNNDRYHAPNEDPSQKLEKALAQIEKHTKTPAIIEMWEQDVAAKKKAVELTRLKREPKQAQQEQNISNVFIR